MNGAKKISALNLQELNKAREVEAGAWKSTATIDKNGLFNIGKEYWLATRYNRYLVKVYKDGHIDWPGQRATYGIRIVVSLGENLNIIKGENDIWKIDNT